MEYFGIADIDGNLSVSIPRAIFTVLALIMVVSVCNCVMEGAWTLHNILSGIQTMLGMIILEMVVGIPIFMVGRKNPKVLKKRIKISFFISLVL